MQKRNLESNIRTLKNMRDSYHSQLDISVITELNAVITDLEVVGGQQKSEQKQIICLRALRMIAVVLRLVSNIKDLL
jgi:hypothetical protein